MKQNTSLAVFFALIFLLSACGPAANKPTAAASVTMDVSGVAQGTSSSIIPAVSAGTDVAWSEVMPEYTRLDLQGYPIGKAASAPQIFVYPVNGLDLNDVAAKAAQDLKALLQSQQVGKTLPFLPVRSEVQMMRAQVQFLDFKSGKGVRYLTEWSSGMVPVNNRHMIYTYQGLTKDGKYYVAAQLPVNLASLPADEMSLDNLPPEFSTDYNKYRSDIVAMLDQQTAGSFTPDLSKLDAMVKSIEVK